MQNDVRALAGYLTRIVVALGPWALSLYLQYEFEYGGLWEVDMPYRAGLSVLLIALGMLTSFYLYSRLSGAAKSRRQR